MSLEFLKIKNVLIYTFYFYEPKIGVFIFWNPIVALMLWRLYTTTLLVLYYCWNFISYFFPFFSCCLNYFSIRDQESCNLFNPHQWICTTTTSLPSLNNSNNNNSKHVQPLRIPLVHCYEKCKQTAEWIFVYIFRWMKKNRCICPSFPFYFYCTHAHNPGSFYITLQIFFFLPCFL